MAFSEQLMFGPTGWTVVTAQANNTTATSTKSGITNKSHFITSISVSCTGAPGSIMTVQVKDGSTVLDQFEIPVSAFSPFMFNYGHALKCSDGADAVLTCSASGTSGVKVTVVLKGFTAMSG